MISMEVSIVITSGKNIRETVIGMRHRDFKALEHSNY